MAKRNETPDERSARHEAVIAEVRAENPGQRIRELHDLERAAVAQSGIGFLAVEDASLGQDTFIPNTPSSPATAADIAAEMFKLMKADREATDAKYAADMAARAAAPTPPAAPIPTAPAAPIPTAPAAPIPTAPATTPTTGA